MEPFLRKTKIYFFMCTTLSFRGRGKQKTARDICKRTLDIEFERDWSVGLGATLGDGQKIKNYCSSFRDFFRESKVSYCWASKVLKPTIFNQNRLEPIVRTSKF